MILTKLYQHQIDNLNFHLSRPRSGDWSEQGCGKTLIALSKIDNLKQQDLVRFTLVICPKSVAPVWESEIRKHSTLSCIPLVGSLENKIKCLATYADIYIISYDAIPGRERTLGILFHFLLMKRFSMVILDEITYVKNYNALRTKAVTAFCDSIRYRLSLSGTPITNSPSSVLTIYRIVDGGQTFGRNYFAARNMFFENRGFGFPDWHLRVDKEEEFKRKLFFNAVRLLKTDCLDLPPKIFTERYAEITGIQRDIYKRIADELLKDLILPAGRVKIMNSLVKLAKLSQLANGFLYTDKGVQSFPSNPKLALLEQTIDEIPTDDKIVIFCKWTQDIHNISELLDRKDIKYEVLSGSTKNRQLPIQSFVHEPSTKILLSQITVGAYGLTLTASHTIIYYSLGFGAIEYWQSQDRIHRIGQNEPCLYINLLCQHTIDEYIYSVLKEKTDIAKSLLDTRSLERLKANILCV